MRCPWEWVCSASEDPLLGGYSTYWTRVVVEVVKSDFLGSDNHAAVNFANIFFFNSLEHSNSDTERPPVRTHQGLVLLVQLCSQHNPSFWLYVPVVTGGHEAGDLALLCLPCMICSAHPVSPSRPLWFFWSFQPMQTSLSPPSYFLPGTLPSAIASASWVMKGIVLP